MKKRILYYFFLLSVSFLFVFAFSFATSPFYLGYAGDASVYKQMGLLILQGGVPYVDLCDNKGILLYLFNAAGMLISPKWGTCILQGLLLFSTTIIWDKILQYFLHNNLYRVLCILASLLLLLCFYETGDMTEDLSLPFISIPILLWSKMAERDYPLQKVIKYWFYTGLCFGTIVFIRINNALPFVWFYAYTIVDCIVRKRPISMIGKMVAASFAGNILVTALCLLITSSYGSQCIHGMLYWMFAINFDVILFRFAHDIRASIMVITPSFLFSIATVLLFWKKPNYLIPILLSIISVSVSLFFRPFPHYEMILIPIYLLILGKSMSEKKWVAITIILITSALHFSVLYTTLIRSRREIFLGRVWFKEAAEKIDRFASSIPDKKKAKVFNLAEWPGLSMCNRAGIVAESSNISEIYQELHVIAESEHPDNYPQYIIYSTYFGIPPIDSSFVWNNYHVLDTIGTYSYVELFVLQLNSEVPTQKDTL